MPEADEFPGGISVNGLDHLKVGFGALYMGRDGLPERIDVDDSSISVERNGRRSMYPESIDTNRFEVRKYMIAYHRYLDHSRGHEAGVAEKTRYRKVSDPKRDPRLMFDGTIGYRKKCPPEHEGKVAVVQKIKESVMEISDIDDLLIYRRMEENALAAVIQKPAPPEGRPRVILRAPEGKPKEPMLVYA